MSATAASQSVWSADGTRIAFDRLGDGHTYDRRGLGDSTDTPPYAPEREVEDLDALIAEAGGPAHLFGFSSGALLAMRAAAQGLPIRRLALLEPPLGKDDAGPDPLTEELAELVGAGRNSEAVEH